MKITRIRLKDWGRHKELDESFDTQVVGLIGINNSGKSLVLKAIKYAFTNDLDDKAETYVRDMGQGEAKNASVTVWFEKNGRDGVISRQVGANARRKLIWDGSEFTRAKDVEAVLSDIFGADRQAVSNAVFVSQGELERLLYGTQAEREAMWLRLMNLNFLESRYDMVDRRIALLSSGLQDMTMHVDELKAQIAEAQANADEKAQILQGFGRYDELSKLLDIWTELRATYRNLEECGRDLTLSRSEMRDAQAKYHAELRGLHDMMMEMHETEMLDNPHIEQCREIRDSLIYQMSVLDHELGLARERLRIKKELAASLAQVTEERGAVERLSLLLAQYPDMNRLVADHEKAVECQTLMRDEEARLQQIAREQAAFMQAANKLIELSDRDGQFQDTTDIDTELEALQEKHVILNTTAEVLTPLKTHGLDRLCDCPVCGSDLSAIGDITQKLTDTYNQLGEIADRMKELRQILKEIQRARTLHENDKVVCRQDMMAAMVRKNHLEQAARPDLRIAATRTSAEWADEARGIQKSINNVRDLVRDLDIAQSRLDAAAQACERIKNRPDYEAVTNTKDSAVWDITQSRSELGDRTDLINNRLAIAEELLRKLQTHTAVQEKHAERLDNLNRQAAKRINMLLELGEPNSDRQTADLKIAELEEKSKQMSAAEGALDEADRQLLALRKKQSDLDNRVEADRRVRSLIEQLRQLKETLGRGGLATTYMHYMFGLIIKRARSFLGVINANFDIQPDPDRAMSLNYVRLDDESGCVLPQEKLSGGQRVRLTIAMLLAVQSILLPEVGLLVLDEPSNHMDEEGVERLRDLLFAVGKHLGNGNMQMIVCDHREALMSAFGHVIRLTGE